MRLILLMFGLLGPLFATVVAAQDFEASIYGGWQTAPHSNVSGQHPNIGAFDAAVGWAGKSFAAPPYYGVRGTWWRGGDRGVAIELTHAKVYAKDADRTALGFDRLEFTDGHNIITVNYMQRWPDRWSGRLAAYTPYAGAGLGIALPHVDAQPNGGARTFGYQLTGPSMRLLAGMSRPIGDNLSAFAEYQFTFSMNEAELDGGGDLSTNIITNALNVGLSYRF